MATFERSSGILLHPTSFPGRYGIGDLGQSARDFVDFLHQTGQKLWQVLPLNPTGYGDSPYASFSAFAGNPLLISPDILLEQNLLKPEYLANVPDFDWQNVDFGRVIIWKTSLLQQSFEHFKQNQNPEVQAELEAFIAGNNAWLDDYAFFMAAKAAHNGILWADWDEGLALRKPESLKAWRTKLAEAIEFQKYIQFLFYRQWLDLKNYANDLNIKIIGDIPIFVAYDSADVWANPEIFYLDEKGRTTVVAGVPPDYFSATGQYWGNPLYRWDVLKERGYDWWLDRFRNNFKINDIVRLDHFRGFSAYWEIPANPEQTAVNGQWVEGPGIAFFQAIQEKLGVVPIIAEDLGVITPDVEAMRDEMNYPGMRVLQFAFGAFDTDATDPFLPHNFINNTFVYTGTHDNDTTAGWYEKAGEQEKKNVCHYLDVDVNSISAPEISWKLIRLAWSSVADVAITPLQDTVGIGSEGRMNFPGKAESNWSWRYHPDTLSDWLKERLLDITLLYARYIPPRATPPKGQGNI